MHGKRVCNAFEMKHFGEYYDLYLKSDGLILADNFENFTNICIKIYELDPAKLLSVSGLAWQAALKEPEVKLELLTDIDMYQWLKKELKMDYVMQFINMQKLITSI